MKFLKRFLTSKPTSKNKTAKEYEDLGRMLETIYETGAASRGQMLKMSFLKGIAAGFGGVVGATIVVGLVIWALSLFDKIPFIDTDPLRDTIQAQKR